MRLRVLWGGWRGQERLVWVVSKQAQGMRIRRWMEGIGVRKEVKGLVGLVGYN